MMQPFPHRYTVSVSGDPGMHGTLVGDGVPSLPTAPPPQFGGPGDAWSPEQLFLASVGTCFLHTFRAVAAASSLPFTRIEIACEGVLDRADHVTRFSEIVLRPTLTLGPEVDHDRARRLMEKAERGCLVTASLSTPTRLEPTVEDDVVGVLEPVSGR